MVRCSRRALQVEGPRFTSIAVGREHSCAIAADSTAYCWGANAKGQLGRGSRDTLANSRPRPVAGGWRWRAIAAGSNHTCGITAANVVHCWGDNSLRQLGMPGQFKLVPTYVPIRRDRKSR
jgi:alpha-tubulin suppressor-like RCC1 family protein